MLKALHTTTSNLENIYPQNHALTPKFMFITFDNP